MRTIGLALATKHNNFDLLRAIAAIAVLTAHSFGLTHNAGTTAGAIAYGFGNFAAGVFFTTSGFLVTRSALEHGLLTYIASRALRIVPVIACIFIFTAHVVGVTFTTLPAHNYLTSPDTIWYLRGLNPTEPGATLPGVFKSNPEPVVNGSMWTLPYELLFYTALPVLASIGLLRPKAAIGIAVLFLAATMLVDFDGGPRSFSTRVTPHVYLAPMLHFGAMFFVGGALFVHRERIPLSGWIALPLLVALLIFHPANAHSVVDCVVYPYLTLYLALGFRVPHDPTRWTGDLSFGIFGYSFPVQQSLIALLGALSPVSLTLLTMLIVLPMAFASWRWIEKPFLIYRHDARLKQADAFLAAWRGRWLGKLWRGRPDPRLS